MVIPDMVPLFERRLHNTKVITIAFEWIYVLICQGNAISPLVQSEWCYLGKFRLQVAQNQGFPEILWPA